MLRLTATVPDLRRPAVWRPPTRLQTCAAITAVSFVSYILGQSVSGELKTLFAVGGVASCGWAWMLTRALFDPAEREAGWALVVAAIVWLTGGVSILAEGPVGSVAGNAYALSGSAALLLTFVEPLHGFRAAPAPEKRFRIAFLTIFALLVVFSSLLMVEAGQAAGVNRLCAAIGLAGAAGAVWFRLRSPLPRPQARRRSVTDEHHRLGRRIEALLRDESFCDSPDLKVADLADRLGEPEYRVSQAIAALGFANFNRLINHHRIARAKRMLRDPALAGRSILLIAFDCGFASLGPFNRAFKDETGMTPRAWRNQAD